MISIGGSAITEPSELLQHAAGRLHARDERLDQIFFGPGGVADGDEVLLGIDEDQPVARSVPRRLGDQLAVFGQRRLDIFQRHAGRRLHACDGRKLLGRDLVEGQMRRRRAGAGEGNAAHFAHRLKLAILRHAAMQAEHQQAVFGLGLVERLFDRADARPSGLNGSSNGRECPSSASSRTSCTLSSTSQNQRSASGNAECSA